MRTDTNTSRSLDRRRVYLGEGLTLRDRVRERLAAGRGDRPHPRGPRARGDLATDVLMPAVGEVVSVRYTGRGASGGASRRWSATSAACRPRAGRSRGSGSRCVPDTTHGRRRRPPRGRPLPVPRCAAGVRGRRVPVVLRRDACASGSCTVGAGGMTLRRRSPTRRCCPRAELDFELHLRVDRRRARPRAPDVGAARRARRRLRGRRRVDRSAARAARRAVALSPGRRRDADARGAARRRPHRRRRRARGHLRLRHLRRRLRGDPRPAPARPPGRGSPRQRVDRRPALAVRRALAPSHLPLRRADRRLRARRSSSTAIRRAASTCRSAATRSRSGSGTPASSRAARARRIRTSSAPASTSR